MKIISDVVQKVVIGRAEVEIIGLANLGRGGFSLIDSPGSFSIPAHQLPGVYAGIVTRGLNGNELQNPLPVFLLCNDEEQKINIKTNNSTGTWISSVKYDQVEIYNSALSRT